MSVFSRISRFVYLIELLLLALLIVPTVHAQDSSDQILYTVGSENGDNTVYTVNVDDGTKTQIGVIHNLYDAGWSPDSKLIYLLDYEKEFGIRVTLLDVDTNRRQTLPDPLNDIVCWLPIWWSPDSRWLSYTAAPNPNPLRKLYNVSTGETQILPDADISDDFSLWSPDSRYLAYKITSKVQTYKMAIWDVQKQRTALVINVNINSLFPEWSSTEDRIAFQEADSNAVIIHNLNDGTKQQYENGHIGNWSPDGHYLTIEHHDNAELQIIDTHTQKPVEFGGDIGALGVGPRIDWSSDSRYLVTSVRENDHPNNDLIFIVDMLKRSIQSTKIIVPDYVQLTWSRQGNRFAFASNTEYLQEGAFSTSLWLYDVDDHQPYHYKTKILAYYYSSLSRFNWSSTGLYMTVQTDSGTALLDWASKQLSPINADGKSLGQPRWSPDGTKLALSSGSWDTGDIFIFNPTDKTFTNLTSTPDEGETFLGWRGANQNDSMIGPCGET